MKVVESKRKFDTCIFQILSELTSPVVPEYERRGWYEWGSCSVYKGRSAGRQPSERDQVLLKELLAQLAYL